MTVTAQTSSNSSTGNGVTTVFPYTFKIIDDGDIEVRVDGVLKTLSTHYTVSGVGDNAGGNVTMLSAPANGAIVARRRNMALVREVDYQYQGTLPAAVLNPDQDAPVLMAQQLQEQIGRSLRGPAGETWEELAAAADRLDLFPVFDATTGALELSTVTQTQVASAVAAAYAAGSTADAVTFLQEGTGATSRTVQAKLRDVVSVKDFGAVGDGTTNDTAAFTAAGSAAATLSVTVPPGTYNLATSPAPTGSVTWMVEKGASFTGSGSLSFLTNKIVSQGAYRSIESSSAFYSGIFGYLEQNAALSGYGVIGLHGAVQTAGGTGASNEADIGVAGFAANNLAGGGGGAWALYGTAIHESGVVGSTHGLELDIANIGSTVALFPSAMFPAGNTNALWLGSGGEVTATPGAAKTASCAIGVISNDPAGTANFEKGIVFHNKSISGCDGATGNGVAVAFASGHQMNWYNNSGQAVGEIVCNAKVLANSIRLDFSDSGVLFADRGTGSALLQIPTVASAANYFTFTAGAVPELSINGSGTDVDFYINPKGAGVVRFGAYTAGVVAQAGYITIKDNGGTVRRLLVG